MGLVQCQPTHNQSGKHRPWNVTSTPHPSSHPATFSTRHVEPVRAHADVARGLCSFSRRALVVVAADPDVSMVGSNYPVTMRGFHVPLGGGTSSSTPVFAGVITLLNQARAAVGKVRESVTGHC